jgi:hypothetical protein
MYITGSIGDDITSTPLTAWTLTGAYSVWYILGSSQDRYQLMWMDSTGTHGYMVAVNKRCCASNVMSTPFDITSSSVASFILQVKKTYLTQ